MAVGFGWQKAAGAWVGFVMRHPRFFLAFTLITAAAALIFSAAHFSINVDQAGMISEKLPFRQAEKKFSSAFPDLSNNIVIVIDGVTADQALSARARLFSRLDRDKALYKSIYVPGGGDFFEKNGLLYLSLDELQDFADSMASAQPFLAFLSKDAGLNGLFRVLTQVFENPESGLDDARVLGLLNALGRTFEAASAGGIYPMPWQEIMAGGAQAESQRRQFIILQPEIDPQKLSSSEAALEAVRKAVNGLGLDSEIGLRVRITGDVALNEENLVEVRNTVGLATVISFLLVAAVLYIGLGRSARLILASLATLAAGLVWTTAFAVAAIGSLNMISITFAVLFIGLGIDYSIQLCLRYRELLASGANSGQGMITAASGIGKALFLSCVTTAIGFYSFLPTAYAGVAELGLISGTGMFISLFANLTVLPALLTVMNYKRKKAFFIKPRGWAIGFPYRHPRKIAVSAVIIGLSAAVFLPKAYFDYNPLNLYNPDSESVETVKELFKDPMSAPWTASALANSAEEAKDLSARLGRLKEVKSAVTVFDFVPERQPEKLAVISDIRLFMPEQDSPTVRVTSCAGKERAVNRFRRSVRDAMLSSSGDAHSALRRLYQGIEKLASGLSGPSGGCAALDRLESGVVSDFPELYGKLKASLKAGPVTLSSLPEEITSQYVSPKGLYRVQVFPAEDIMDRKALERFVNAVYSITPEATDSPVIMYESGKAVLSSFGQAVVYALAAIVIFLLAELRSLLVTFLILIPLFVSMVLTGAASVLFGIPLNFANVIVVPLLLGVGVHNGILFAVRYRTEPPVDGNMLKTSTARAALLSLVTVMISTGSLSFSAHRGISSIGVLFTLCLVFLVVSTLVLLPAIFEIFKKRLK